MKHKEVIEKIAQYKLVHDFRNGNPQPSWTETGKQFGISPQQAAVRDIYYERHKNDPQCALLGDETHESVLHICRFTGSFDISSLEALRACLCNKFRAQSTNGKMNHPHSMPRQPLIKLLKASKLRWFQLDGVPWVHYDEQP